VKLRQQSLAVFHPQLLLAIKLGDLGDRLRFADSFAHLLVVNAVDLVAFLLVVEATCWLDFISRFILELALQLLYLEVVIAP